jgi:hypothetical protein
MVHSVALEVSFVRREDARDLLEDGMFVRQWICVGVAFVGVVLVGACDRPQQQGKGVATTTTRPAVAEGAVDAAPTTLPTSRPTTSTLVIRNQPVTFPPARLVLQQREPNLTLLLFSDDPETAIKADYAGNRYYLEIELDINDVAHLMAADWHYKAASIERADSPNGIFLEGDRKHIQPYDVNIVFSGAASQITATINGTFMLFQGREQSAPQSVLVQGVLVAELEGMSQGGRPVQLR